MLDETATLRISVGGRAMFSSVRVRLTLWYSALLAVFLLVISLLGYFIFQRNAAQRTDAELAQLADAFLVTLQDELKDQQESGGLAGAARQAILEHRFRDHWFAILDAKGEFVTTSPDSTASDSQKPVSLDRIDARKIQTLLSAASTQVRAFRNIPGPRSGYRGFAERFAANDQSYTLLILRSLHSQKEMLDEIQATFAWLIPLAIFLAAAGGYFLARKSLEPVAAMSAQASRIGAANLRNRLSVRGADDELGHLAQSFNLLLDRLERSFEQQKRFMADASHELRTPVAILRGEAEVALSQPARRAEEYRESLAILLQEARRLALIVEDLFTLTRADAGQYDIAPKDFYLEELVNDCVHSIRALALGKSVTLAVEPMEECPIVADEGLLRRMLVNLLDNAIKYTPEGGRVTVTCCRQGDEYALSVSDTGTGIPAELQARIFERFFRADQARSRTDQNRGAGLGLAIARWVAEAHHGRLELSHSDSYGSVFTVFLRVAAVPSLQPH
jgi:heavy metal sensor kinase